MTVSIVTGASRGIGRSIAKRLAATSTVFLVGREPASLEEVVDEIEAAGGKADYFVGNVKDIETAKEVVTRAIKLGPIQNLVLNAGISKSGPSAAFPESALKELFDVNFFGSVNFIKETLPSMLEKKSGSIVLLTGTAALQGYSTMAGYCASKHALLGYARGLAQEVGKKGIQVFPVCPGPVDTDMTAGIVKFLVGKGMTTEAAKEKIANGSNQKRLITTDEVADVVFDMCAGKFIGVNTDATPYTFQSSEIQLYV